MKLSDYQERALLTDQTPHPPGSTADTAILIPLLGLAGEAGQLVSEFKKRIRDGQGHILFVDRVAEELGDILWYVANLASKYDLDLDDIATRNLKKVAERWDRTPAAEPLDTEFHESERFPRRIVARFTQIAEGERVEVRTEIEGKLVGSALTDNSYDDDGYRFHDVFHLSYAAVLGWSPVLRGLLKLKRKSSPRVDEVEDGGRAAVIEEGVAALVFDYARRHQYFSGVDEVDGRLLSTIRGMCAHLEVAKQPLSAWRRAILQGYEVWRLLLSNGGGEVHADLETGEIHYSALPTATAMAPAEEAE